MPVAGKSLIFLASQLANIFIDLFVLGDFFSLDKLTSGR